jgi:hypothetical protein
LLTLALAGGIKGFTQYKFVESQNWYDSPLAQDGTIQPSYEPLKQFMHSLENVDIGKYGLSTNIGIVANKLNNWISLLEEPAEYQYAQILNEFTMPEIGRDLDRIKQDFVIPDLDNPMSFEGLKTLFVPITEIMDEQHQEFLVDLAKHGVNLVLVGQLPRCDSGLKNCSILANAINCKTQGLGKIGTVTTAKDKFPSYIFGSINSTARKTKKLASYGKKNVGIVINKFKGTIVLLTFDSSSQGNHMKINFTHNMLDDLGVKFPIMTSHPSVRVFLHRGEKNDKTGVLYLLNSTPTQQFRQSLATPTKVVVQVDLKAFGIKGSKLRMKDLFTNEEILTTVDELKEGLYFTLSSIDSRAYYFKVG